MNGPGITVPRLLGDRAAVRGAHPLLICDDDVLSYEAAVGRSAAVAKGLLAWGCGKGSHVGLLFPNGADFAVAALGAARIGAVVVPLSTFSTGAELAQLLLGADVDVLLAAASYRRHDYQAAVAEALPGADLAAPGPLLLPTTPALRRLAFQDAGPLDRFWTRAGLEADGAAVPDAVLAAVEDSVGPADRMVIVHTSGSTSEPKGVIHCHGPLLRHLEVLNELRRYQPDDVLFSNSPFFWIGGFAYSLLGTLLAGATLVCSNAADPTATLDLLERVRPTMVNGFAATVARLAADPSFPARDLSSIRRGNLYPIMPDDVRPADPDLRHNLLGMTEAGSVCLVSSDESDQPESRRGSFGRPTPDLEAAVVDPDDGRRLGPGEVGELWLRGPALMDGYYGRERHRTFSPDGWYHTGDLFHRDGDGFFYFHGRRGDLIKTAGANVSPREVEAAILAETGLVAHVVGLDDESRGQVVAAAVSVPPGAAAPDPDDLGRRLRTRLSAYKVPRRIVALPDAAIPVLSSGKLDARALKEMLSHG